MPDGGKGDSPRPFSVSQEEFDTHWDVIFGKKKKTQGELQSEAFLKDEYYDLEDKEDTAKNDGC